VLALLMLAAAHGISIRALGTGDGDPDNKTTVTNPPPGVLVGYKSSSEKKVTGTHIEYIGWIGASFGFVVNTYETIDCCRRTDRMMDGCSGLPVCSD